MKHFPSPHPFPPLLNYIGLLYNNRDHHRKNSMSQALFKKSLEKSIDNRGDKDKDTRGNPSF
jgi:hypothetical protein